MPNWQAIARIDFLGNDLGQWGLALLTFLITFTVLPLAKRYIGAVSRRLSNDGQRKVHFSIDLTASLAERTSSLFIWAAALYFASRHLSFPPRVERIETIIIVMVFWLQVGLWAMASVRYAIDLKRRQSAGLDTLLASSIDLIMFAAGLLIWGMTLLLALDNLGVEIKPLLAGLGIGGIAIALAVQSVLGDLLASMSIALDKPFGVGDSLNIGDMQGTVEHIGVKSTRLRALSGEQIIISNAEILKSRMRNYGRMRDRRAVFNINVAYDTSLEKLQQIPLMVRTIVEAIPQTRFDRCHLLTYGDKALQYEVVFFMTTADYLVYADAQQKINLDILQKLREMKVALPAAGGPTVVNIQNWNQNPTANAPAPAVLPGQTG